MFKTMKIQLVVTSKLKISGSNSNDIRALKCSNDQNPIGDSLEIESSLSLSCYHKDVTGGGWVLLITKVINSGEAFCAFTLL